MNSENQPPVYQGMSQPQSTSTAQTATRPISTESHPEIKSGNSSSNPALSRALVGGLIGATVGLLAGRKVFEGLNRANEGAGKAFGTIKQGLGTTAKGLGEVAKSIGDGVSYAVVGGTTDAAQNLAEGVQQAATTTANTVQQVGDAASQTIDNTAKAVQSSSQPSGQSVIDNERYAKSIAVDTDNLQQFGYEGADNPYSSPAVLDETDPVNMMEVYDSIERAE